MVCAAKAHLETLALRGMGKTCSHEISTACLGYLRFAKRMPYVATEFKENLWRADVYAANKELAIEVEVKVSTSDFKADFLKGKHALPLRGPNKFYFAVPLCMKAFALEQLAKYPNYGLLVYDQEVDTSESWMWKRLSTVRKAAWLHRDRPKECTKKALLMRMGSELFGFHLVSHLHAGLNEVLRTQLSASLSAPPDIEDDAY